VDPSIFETGKSLRILQIEARVDFMEDLGVGIGELSFDAILQDASWDAPPIFPGSMEGGGSGSRSGSGMT
jgi:hypothetical protein